MPRRNIAFERGQIYHLYNRGAGKAPIFFHPENYSFFTTKCWTYSRTLSLPILAFCLMPNHYHLIVIQAGDIPAGKLVQRVCNSYSKALNKRLDRKGTLFQGRYQAKRVSSQDYLQHLCVYVHLNPVAAGLVQKPEEWPHSDFHRWIAKERERSSLRIHEEFGLTLGEDYREMVDAVLSGKHEELPSPRHWPSAGDSMTAWPGEEVD